MTTSSEPSDKGDCLTVRCRCVWVDARCPNPATQEDGLCDWCGTRRPEQLRDNPNAIFDLTTGEYLALGGGPETHVDPNRSPDACWMPGSGAVRATEGT
jgi:hypothetical protein